MQDAMYTKTWKETKERKICNSHRDESITYINIINTHEEEKKVYDDTHIHTHTHKNRERVLDREWTGHVRRVRLRVEKIHLPIFDCETKKKEKDERGKLNEEK